MMVPERLPRQRFGLGKERVFDRLLRLPEEDLSILGCYQAALLAFKEPHPSIPSTASSCLRTAEAVRPISLAATSMSCFSATAITVTRWSNFTLGGRMPESPEKSGRGNDLNLLVIICRILPG